MMALAAESGPTSPPGAVAGPSSSSSTSASAVQQAIRYRVIPPFAAARPSGGRESSRRLQRAPIVMETYVLSPGQASLRGYGRIGSPCPTLRLLFCL